MRRPILRVRSLAAVLATAVLTLAAAPAALASSDVACIPVQADAAGFRDASGRLREPNLGQAPVEAPRSQGRPPGDSFDVTIQVYVHVITDGDNGDVTFGTIAQQMNVLNQTFGGAEGGTDTGFSFDLADVDYTDNAAWFAAGPGSRAEAEMKQTLKQGGPGDLNVYSTSGNAYLGWAYYPTIVGTNHEYLDGIVIDYRSMPGGPYGAAYSLGETLTHEGGHWFGLAHTFEGGCGGPGDMVADTPYEKSPSIGCPVGKDSCPNKAGLDPIHNYMDYSYDSCYTEFTPGQTQRAQDQYLAFRS